MKVSLTARAARAAMARMNKVIPNNRTRPAIPELKNVQVSAKKGAVFFRGGNLEQDLTVGIVADSDEDGTLLVNAATLRRFVAVLDRDDPVEIGMEAQGSVLTSGDLTFRFPCDDPEAYPKTRTVSKPIISEVDFDAVAAVLPATSTDNNRPILTTVVVDGGDYAATDSYRLYHVHSSTSAAHMLIPRETCLLLRGITGVHPVKVGQRSMVFEGEGFRLWSYLLEGAYPNYKGLLPDSSVPSMVTFGPDLKMAIKRVCALTGGTGIPVQFIPGRPVKIAANGNDGCGQIEVALHDAQASFKVAFKPEYLNEILVGAPDEVGVIYGDTALHPAAMRWTDAEGREHTRLLMPVRVS